MFKLKKQPQFQRVYKKGRKYKVGNLTLYLLTNNLNYNRIGVSIPSRETPLSVRRNRARRLILEGYRLSEDLLKKGYDMVFISRGGISKNGLDDVMKEALKLYERSGILV